MTAVTHTLSADRPWRTRGELLAARAEAVPAIERNLYAADRLAGQTGLLFVVAVAGLVIGQALVEDNGVTPFLVVVAAAVGVGAAVQTVRMAVQNRALMAGVLAWERAERAGRRLPADDVRPEHRTPFDARRDPDFFAVAGDAGAAAYVRPWRLGLLIRACVLGLWTGLGLILTLIGAFALPDRFGIGALAGGVVPLVEGLVGVAAWTRYSFRLTRLSAQLEGDLRDLASERPADDGQQLMTPGRRALMLTPVALPLLAFLLIRIGDASTVALAITGGILAVIAVGAIVVVLVRSRRTAGRSGD